ncbi:MAG: hypothetical protein JKY54_09490, partial [Flavobacteriales bacterium]|nr:hypothetical protein [Flavobacteriales bacterium]
GLEQEGTTGELLNDRIERYKEETYSSLFEIESHNRRANEELSTLASQNTVLVTAIRVEAEQTELKLRRAINPISRTQGRVTYRTNYFTNKLGPKLALSIAEEAKQTRWTKGRRIKIDRATKELFQLFKSLQGQELSNAELIDIQRKTIAAFDILNNYIKGDYNLYNPEFSKLRDFSDRIAAEGKLFRLSISKRIVTQRIPLEAARKVLRSKRLDAYIKRYVDNVTLAAPNNHKKFTDNTTRIELLIYLNERKVEEGKKLAITLQEHQDTVQKVQDNLPEIFTQELLQRHNELTKSLLALQERNVSSAESITSEDRVALKTVEPTLEKSALLSETDLSDAKNVSLQLTTFESELNRLDQMISDENVSSAEIKVAIEQLEKELNSTGINVDQLQVETAIAEELLTEYGTVLDVVVPQVNAMLMGPGGTIGTVPWGPKVPWVPVVVFNATFYFTVDPNYPLTINFINTSTTNTSFTETEWVFGDSNSESGYGRINATHKYDAYGSYPIILRMQCAGQWKQIYYVITLNDNSNTGGSGTVDPVAINELWIRAYPDDIAIHSHNPKLNESEYNAGKVYWDTIWNAKGDLKLELAAWTSLLKKFGPQRSAWVARALTPTNIANRPQPVTEPNDGGQTSTMEPTKSDILAGDTLWKKMDEVSGDVVKQEKIWIEFQDTVTEEKAMEVAYISLETEKTIIAPDDSIETLEQQEIVAINSPTGTEIGTVGGVSTTSANVTPEYPLLALAEGSWNQGNESRVMPRKLLFAAYRRNGLDPYLKFGNDIPSPLPTGIDPDEDQAFTWDNNGNLIVTGAIKWMVDFEEAVNVGMAVRMPVTLEEADPEDADSGFERVVVVGVRDQDSDTQAKLGLEELFENHHYTRDGLSFIPQGTATNNTGTSNSGFSPANLTSELSFEVEQLASKTSTTVGQLNAKKNLQKTDGDFLAEQLRLNPAVFNHLLGADNSEIADAHGMNQALWAGTLGSYLEDVFYSNDPTFNSILNQETLDKTRDFFINNVKARGSFPILRIKNQPYGILPMTNFKREEDRMFDNLGTDFDTLLEDVLVHRMWKGFELGQEWKDKDATGANINPPTEFKTGNSTLSGMWAPIVADQIKNMDDPVTGSDQLLQYQKRFINLLGLLPHSNEVSIRNGIGIEASGLNFSDLIPGGEFHQDGTEFRYSAISGRVLDFHERFYDISRHKEMYLQDSTDQMGDRHLGFPKLRSMSGSTQLSKPRYGDTWKS